jgi:hypothetical protein
MARMLWRPKPSALATLLRNQLLPQAAAPGSTWSANPYDLIVPDVPIQNVIAMFHGAGGTKEIYSHQWLIWNGGSVPTMNNIYWALLRATGTAVIIFQGSYCNPDNYGNPKVANTASDNLRNPWNVTAIAQGPQNTTTWQNGAMNCGSDTVGMLNDLVPWLRTRFPGAKLIHAGQSNGGMLGSQQYLLQTEACHFDLIAPTSGPTAISHIDKTPIYPVPFVSMIGGKDGTLDVAGGHFRDDLWTGNTRSVADVAYVPNSGLWPLQQWIGEWKRFGQRVNWYRAAKGLSPQTIAFEDGVTKNVVTGAPAAFDSTGSWTVWQDSSGMNQLVYWPDSDHGEAAMQTSLATAPGQPATLLEYYTRFAATLPA